MDIKDDVKKTTESIPAPSAESKVASLKDGGTTDRTPKKNTEVKVRLTGDHVHEGIRYEAGDFIDVDEQAAHYIIEIAKNGVKV